MADGAMIEERLSDSRSPVDIPPPGGLEARHYQQLVQAVVDYAIFMLSPDGVVTSWNRGAERIKGYAPDEIIGRHFSTFYTPEDRADGAPERGLEIARREGRFAAEGWRLRKDGTRFWASVVIDAVRDDDGQLIGFAKLTRDFTERHAAQTALIESERRFRLLVEGVTDYAIFMLDLDGRVTNWNVGAQRIKGYAPEEIIGEHFSRFYTPEDREAGAPGRALETARREGRFAAEGWRVRKDGTRFWAMVVIDAIRDEAGELIGFTKITRDMTERREAELRLEQTRGQLLQAQKMEALGQLTGGMAHDFNNLLTAIISGTELALRHQGNPEKQETLLRAVLASAQRGGGLTRQLLAFARRQPLETKVVDLREELPEVAALIRHSVSAQIELVTEISDQLWRIDIDAGQLQLALLNLAFNARDAMPSGGTLRISAANVELEGEPDGLVGPYVSITVADTGQGIPDEIRARVFEPFFTTKSFGKGTGLGLSQVYGFAHQSKGALTLASEEGRGTTITLYLPATGRSGEAERAARSRGAARILIVEDEPVVAELAAALVEELGFLPVVVESGREALARLARDSGFDLVFADVIMPGGMSGVELARKIRGRSPEQPILLTTGYSETVGDDTAEFPLLAKPYDLASLARMLRSLLPRRAPAPATQET
jgi:PAS domain S-box-containing protein